MKTLILLLASAAFAQDVLILTMDGKWKEGPAKLPSAWRNALSLHNGAPASAYESQRIEAALAAVQGANRADRDKAVEELTHLGLAALSPLLKALKDTNQQEPKPLYNLFNRLIPSTADQADRQASLFRLATGTMQRGPWPTGKLTVAGESIDWSSIRLLAVRQKSIRKQFTLHSLRHCTQIEYLDSGVYLSAPSAASLTASGFTRLAFNDDSWSSGPGGLTKPGGNYKTNLVDGHPFGALVGRVTSGGEVQFWGASANKTGLPAGRLYFSINDNRHWQNNLGSYSVTLTVRNAYDLGDAQ
jgi:hypothetical protein